MKYELLTQLLKYLIQEKDYVSGKKIAETFKTSEKTVLKYLNLLKEEIIDHGATIEVKQGYGSRLIIKDHEKFNQYVSAFSMQENGILENPQSRKSYVMMRLLTDGTFVDLYELADELYVSPSLLRVIIKEIGKTVSKYDLQIEHSHKNGYRIIGDESKVRRCLSQECRDIQTVFTTISNNSKDFSQQLTTIIANSLHRFGIAMNGPSINGLKLHIIIAINRIETNHPIQFESSFDLIKMRGTPEYFVASYINQQLEKKLNISLSDNELLYLTMHINGKQRMNEHQYLKVKVSEEDIVFCNKFLRNIYRLADVDFFEDDELRIALLNHIVPFRNRVKNGMQINRKDLESIRNSFPYSYELALLGLSMYEQNQITSSEIAYFSLHLELSLEKHLQTDQQYNLTVITDEINNLYQIISFKLNKQLGNLIGKIQFTTPETINDYVESTDLFINMTDLSFELPKNIVKTSTFMTNDEIEMVHSSIQSVHSQNRLEELLNPNLYMEFDAGSKEECIDIMLERIHLYIDLPNDYRQKIIEREQLGSTEYSNYIAIPHAINNENVPDFLAIARLKKPIIWQEKAVSLIFLLGSSNTKTSAWFLQRIGIAIQRPSVINALMDAHNYKSFMNTFLSI